MISTRLAYCEFPKRLLVIELAIGLMGLGVIGSFGVRVWGLLGVRGLGFGGSRICWLGLGLSVQT